MWAIEDILMDTTLQDEVDERASVDQCMLGSESVEATLSSADRLWVPIPHPNVPEAPYMALQEGKGFVSGSSPLLTWSYQDLPRGA